MNTAPGLTTVADPFENVPESATITARLVTGAGTILPTAVTVAVLLGGDGQPLPARTATFIAPDGLPVTLEWVEGSTVVARETVHGPAATATGPTTYATLGDLVDYAPATVLEGIPASDLERELAAAERDVDRVLGPLYPDPETGLKIDPANLTTAGAAALARAVCAQTVHRLTALTAATSASRGAVKKVSGPDFSEEYADTTAAMTAASAGSTQLSPFVELELYPLRYLRPSGARAHP